MKKYVKPELVYESFELTQQIAACDFDLVETTVNGEGCKFTGVDDLMGPITIFRNNCRDVANNEWVVESYCYHNASESDYGIFNS